MPLDPTRKARERQMTMKTDRNRRGRVWPASMLLILGLLAAYQGASAFVHASGDPRDKIEAGLLERVAAQETETFWVLLRGKANLAPALHMADPERGNFVPRELQDVADRTQASLRAFLDDRAAPYEAFWVVNTIRVTGNEGLLLDIAARSDVASVVADVTYSVTPPNPRERPNGSGPEWGLDLTGVLLVWNQLNVRGEGIVLANLDTGVQFDHPALVTQYRGNLGGGNFDHNYNWFDATGVCVPTGVPCDNVGIGTHTMGIMVGEDGANQIGVAPKANWIAIKSCESNTCSNTAVLRAGQWILAPRNLNGGSPNPALRPDAVTVSWGTRGGRPFYQGTI